MTPKRLPTFKGYIVDVRLMQFRKIKAGKLPEFIDFDSEKGLDLIEEMENNKDAIQTYQDERLGKLLTKPAKQRVVP